MKYVFVVESEGTLEDASSFMRALFVNQSQDMIIKDFWEVSDSNEVRPLSEDIPLALHGLVSALEPLKKIERHLWSIKWSLDEMIGEKDASNNTESEEVS